MATSETERLGSIRGQPGRRRLRTAGHWLAPTGGLAAVLIASFALLELGLPTASGGARFAATTLRSLLFTYGSGAVIDINGRRLVAHCRTYSADRVVITLSNRQQLLAIGTHIYPTMQFAQALPRLRSERHLFAGRDAGLLAAEADLAGSHRLYALELAATLTDITIRTRELTYAGRAAYALTLSQKPSLILIVAQHLHKPLAALYESARIHASSHFLKQLPVNKHGSGC